MKTVLTALHKNSPPESGGVPRDSEAGWFLNRSVKGLLKEPTRPSATPPNLGGEFCSLAPRSITFCAKTVLTSCLFLLLNTPGVWALPVTGRVRVVGRPASVAVQTIVYAESLDGKTPVQPGHFALTQKNKAFVPHVLAVPAGSTVSFPNDDLIFHNVFSLSRPAPFDLGLYRNGEAKTRTFTAAATYRVFCNIHPQMAAVILVLPTSHIIEADAGGSYRLDLSPGKYRITAWSERGETPASAEFTVGVGLSTVPDLQLDESKFVDAGHKNKFGQDYPKQP